MFLGFPPYENIMWIFQPAPYYGLQDGLWKVQQMDRQTVDWINNRPFFEYSTLKQKKKKTTTLFFFEAPD